MTQGTVEERLAALEVQVSLIRAQLDRLLRAESRTAADLARETGERFKDIPPEAWKEIDECMRQAREELNQPVQYP
jgi:hypothetical protein